MPTTFGSFLLSIGTTSATARTDGLPGVHSHLPLRDGGRGDKSVLELQEENGMKQAAGAPAGFNPRLLDQLFTVGQQSYSADLDALSDADAHQPDRDDDEAVPESWERQQWAMLSAASQVGPWAHPMGEMPAWEGGEPSENSNRQLTQERLIQLTGSDLTALPAFLASVVSAVEVPARLAAVRHPQVLDDLNADTAIVSETEKFSCPSESAEALFAASARPTESSNSLFPPPLPGIPASGFLPFDIEALAQGVDKLVGRLANLGRRGNGPRLRIEIAFWLTTVTAAVFEVARLHARKPLCRSFVETSVRYGPATGMEPEL